MFSAESKQVANFSGHEQKLYCCLWSPTDPDVVFSGGDDCILHAFRISKQKNKRPSGKGKEYLSCAHAYANAMYVRC